MCSRVPFFFVGKQNVPILLNNRNVVSFFNLFKQMCIFSKGERTISLFQIFNKRNKVNFKFYKH